MKSCYNIPISLCYFVITEKLFTEFNAYVALQLFSDGILDLNDALSSMCHLKNLTSLKSRKKCIDKLVQLRWIGLDKIKNVIYLRKIDSFVSSTNSTYQKVVPFYKSNLTTAKSVVYAAVLSEKLQQQKSAIFFQSRKKSAVKKSDAAQQTSYCGLGKFGVAKLFKCSAGQAVKIKCRLVTDGYIATKKRKKKIHTLPYADMNVRLHRDGAFPGISDRLTFLKNKNGTVDIYQQLHDEIKSKTCIKKRKFLFNGIRSLHAA
jgi:hypothetical protein